MNPHLRRWLPPLLLVFITLLPVWPAVVLGHAIGPVDAIRGMVDPAAPRSAVPWNVLQADSLLQFRVWRELVLEAWGQGILPTWNPYSLLGTPLLANSQSGALYPPHIVMGVLHIPLDRAIGLLAWFHLALAGVGTYRLCRALGTDRASAFLGGSGFMFSAFLIAWVPLASVPSTVGWIPWLLLLVQRRRFIPLALVTGMMLLAGHLQFAVYGLVAAGVFALASGGWRMLPAIGVGLLLAAAHLLPVYQFSQSSHRRGAATAEGAEAYARSAIQPWQLGVLGAPAVNGLPQVAAPLEGIQVGGYWPSVVKVGDNFAEGAIGLSPVAFALLAVVPWRDRRVWGVAGVATVGILLALPTALPRLMYTTLPGWSATGSPGRAAVLFVLGGSVLGAIGFSRLRGHSSPNLLRRVVGGGVGIGLLAILCPLLAPANALGVGEEPFAAWRMSALLAGLLPALALVALLIGAASFPPLRRYLPFAAALPLLYASVTYAPGLVPTGVFPNLPNPEAGERVAVVNSRWSFFGTPRALFPPNLLAAARIVDTGGYDSLLDRETKELLDRANGGDSAPAENGNMMFIKPTASEPALRELGVTQIWSRGPDGAPQVRRIAPAGPSISYRPNGLKLDGTTSRARTIYQRAMPGWSGKSGPIPPGTWLQIPPGEQELRYDPPGLRTGLTLSATTFFALLIAGAWGGLRKREKKWADPPAIEESCSSE